MSVNNELEKLYAKYWEELQKNANNIINNTTVKENHPANPFLIKINEKEYEKADLKVMVFGQETWGWNKSFGVSIEEGMNHYVDAKDKYLSAENKGFRQGFNFFKDEIKNNYSNKNIIYIWNNISKIGRYETKGVTTKEIKELEQQYFPVIREEIKILNPDIVIFLTGSRNSDIKFNFPDVSFIGHQNTATLLSNSGKTRFQPAYQVISEYLPRKSVKVYHPSFFGGFNNIKNDAIDVII